MWCRNYLYDGADISNGSTPRRIKGLAWPRSACDGIYRVSVNEEFGQYGSIGTGAHELGHRYAVVITFLPARRYMLARVFATATCPSVCLSVCPSHAGIVPSRAKAGS